jgi:hypothetical protein
MRSILLIALLSAVVVACGSDPKKVDDKPQCSNGSDDDGDGMVDYPDDVGCTDADDDTEDSLPLPKCSDGRDNDNDGKVDFPADPGCFAPQQDTEDDDCPSGPLCPQCSNGKDDDNNGSMDYPNDPGCAAASDGDEYTENPVACGPTATIKKLPFDNHATGTYMTGGASNLQSPTCGGSGPEDIYEIRLSAPKVVVATTDTALTSANTVMYIRSANCADNASEVACNDNSSTQSQGSTITVALQPGTYYLVVDAHDSSTTGSYDLTVHFFVGEGVACQNQDECGPGLVCRVPLGETDKVCSKHVCEDGVDDDGDGKNDYPQDPGCNKPTDDDEMDDCPNGPNCPECGDNIDNDGDTKIDYPMDTTCTSASSVSEACIATEGVMSLTMPVTMGTTVGATNDVKPACASSSGMAPDVTYRLDVPALQSLTISTPQTFDNVIALYNATCTGTALSCSDPGNINLTNVAAGTYYLVIDGWSSGSGNYTTTVSGKIANNASCESALAMSGALTCGTGYACKGTMGSRTCQPAMCSDGMDNDGDTKADFPYDPGCDSPADDIETDTCPGAGCPVCGNGMDDDTDTLTDFPADFGCISAADTNETFCMTANKTETDLPITVITTRNTASTTVGKANDFLPSCQTFSSAPDVTFSLKLPVPVQTLVMDTNNSFDTVLTFKDAHCAAEMACDDDSGTPGLESMITASNVPAGNYAITVDGYNTNSGPFTLHVLGTVAAQTSCSSPLFSGGANAVLQCPAGTTCNAVTMKCQ